MITHSLCCGSVLSLLTALIVVPLVSGADALIDSIMYRSPELPVPQVVEVLPKGQIDLWVRALDMPNAEMKCVTAQSIALAHKRGIKGLEVAIPKLQEELNRAGSDRTARLAIAHSLIALDAKQTADSLFRLLSSDDSELHELIEPALMKWNCQPMRSVCAGEVAVRSAISSPTCCLPFGDWARSGKRKRFPRSGNWLFRQLCQHLFDSRQRGHSVRSKHRVWRRKPHWLMADTSSGGTRQLIAAILLREHRGEEAVRLLQTLGMSPEPTVAAVALTRLFQIDYKLVIPILEKVLASTDANVRSVGVSVLFQQATGSRGPAKARSTAFRSAPGCASRKRGGHSMTWPHEWSYGKMIIREGTTALAGSDWRGQEQAAILLAQLDHKPASKRLLEILAVDRPEAFVTAAWALRQLAVSDTLPAVHEFVRSQNQKLLASGPTAGRGVPAEAIDQQLSQLAQFLGQGRYHPADATLRTILPRRINPGNKLNPAGYAVPCSSGLGIGFATRG